MTKWAVGHIWTALVQMVLCFHVARVTWGLVGGWGVLAMRGMNVMKNDLRGIVLVRNEMHMEL